MQLMLVLSLMTACAVNADLPLLPPLGGSARWASRAARLRLRVPLTQTDVRQSPRRRE